MCAYFPISREDVDFYDFHVQPELEWTIHDLLMTVRKNLFQMGVAKVMSAHRAYRKLQTPRTVGGIFVALWRFWSVSSVL